MWALKWFCCNGFFYLFGVILASNKKIMRWILMLHWTFFYISSVRCNLWLVGWIFSWWCAMLHEAPLHISLNSIWRSPPTPDPPPAQQLQEEQEARQGNNPATTRQHPLTHYLYSYSNCDCLLNGFVTAPLVIFGPRVHFPVQKLILLTKATILFMTTIERLGQQRMPR